MSVITLKDGIKDKLNGKTFRQLKIHAEQT